MLFMCNGEYSRVAWRKSRFRGAVPLCRGAFYGEKLSVAAFAGQAKGGKTDPVSLCNAWSRVRRATTTVHHFSFRDAPAGNLKHKESRWTFDRAVSFVRRPIHNSQYKFWIWFQLTGHKRRQHGTVLSEEGRSRRVVGTCKRYGYHY